jgi:very-short-patch-repair endonuclease
MPEKIPQTGQNAVGNSEMGILNREIRKKRQHKPLRILFQETSNLLPRLKPCFLMSPLSVAQYLSTEQPLFDLVIFDEASQMPVWDAIGAIARGKNLIVVGDPRQLPPTSFFSKSEGSDWEEAEFVEDLDSILEDCLAAGLPSLYLNWHYRSLHESLIAFSNFNYYDNRLHTFPSAYFEGLGLNFVHVKEGIYDKGKSRTNRIEAERIVAHIVKRLKDPALNVFSIGVVTFNASQQTLIEDLLDEERRKSPEIEPFFSENNSESLFVKNLENVQGDERDVIIFSICYGRDLNGRMSMNFGPVNKAGGERRLNVAVTRARREVLVFSSILPDEIDLSRTRAIGVKHLKSYLDFARRGDQAIKETISEFNHELYDSPFEKEVAEALRQKGFEVHTQIGCSGYKIDLAVVHPEYHGRYLLGIECDGAGYHSAKCARERDKLRQSVLESLGWKLHRVWSTDWWHDSSGEIEKTIKKIEDVLKEPLAEFASISPVAEKERVVDFSAPFESSYLNNQPTNPFEKPYIEWRPSESLFNSDQFYSSVYDYRIKKLISEIVNFEGPITLTNLTRKVCTQFQISRATQKAQHRIETLARGCGGISQETYNNQLSYWPVTLTISDYREFRKNTDTASRKAEDIPPQEVAVAAFSVLSENISIEIPDLVRATANSFGFSRVGQNVEGSMLVGIEYMIQNFPVNKEGERVVCTQ